MKLRIILILSLLFISTRLFPQNLSLPNKQAVGIEIGGSGLLYNLNYERGIYNNFSIKIGLSYLNIGEKQTSKNSDVFTMPIAVLYNFPVGGDNHNIQLGCGLNWILSNGDISSFESKTQLYANYVFILGYKYYPDSSNFSYNISFTPYYGNKELLDGKGKAFNIFSSDSDFQLWGGLGLSYRIE